MGCPPLTYWNENEQNFFQGLWKKGDVSEKSYEYYPYGLQTANSWTRENTPGNNYLANGGTELNTTSSLYDLEYRNYDPRHSHDYFIPRCANYETPSEIIKSASNSK